MEVLINNEQTTHDVTDFIDLINQAFLICATREELGGELEVSVSFVENSAMQRLNEEYRGINRTTDVLSFPQDEEDFLLPPGYPRVLGDIVISLEQASEQAQEYGHDLRREVLYLAIHGFLHLLGYDHETAEEKGLMRQKEEEVLAELDLGRE